jgi:NAD(P)-dependent dehydrogenase (short-subunit alcohol dehydrogenase family)
MKNAFDLTGKNAIVTGGNRGLGQGCAIALAQSGANVAILCRDEETGLKTVEDLKQYGGKYEYFHCDITDIKEVRVAVAAVYASFGNIDILINNAGVSCLKDLLDMDEDLSDWYHVVNCDLTAAST